MVEGLHLRLAQVGPIPLDIALSCAPGEAVGVVGPSGAGKSTLLRAIAGLYRVRSGKIAVGTETWFDTETGVDLPAHRRAVGLVFQEHALFPHLQRWPMSPSPWATIRAPNAEIGLPAS